MVVSRINSSIHYPDIKKVDPTDIGFDASLYEIELKPNIFGTSSISYNVASKPISSGLASFFSG